MTPDGACDAVDNYLTHTILGTDGVLDAVLSRNAEAGLPPHDVSRGSDSHVHGRHAWRGAHAEMRAPTRLGLEA